MARICTNRLRPDTCSCVIEFSFDADLPPDKQETSYALVSIVKGSCHSGLSDADAYNAAWHKENKHKNKAESLAQQSCPSHAVAKGTGHEWLDGVEFQWAFSAKREFEFSIVDKRAAPVAIDTAAVETAVKTQLPEVATTVK